MSLKPNRLPSQTTAKISKETRFPVSFALCAATVVLCSTMPASAFANDVTHAKNSQLSNQNDIQAIKLTELTFNAGESDEAVLPQVTVKDNKYTPEKSYQGNKTRVGKTSQLPKDIPQSVTIVPQQLIQDRSANSLKDALRNVAGLTFNAGEGGRIGDNITLRGYSAVGDLYLDGLRDMAQYNREIFNIEQVEVLRGSASMLYGRGSTGGIINQVSKKPLDKDFYNFNLMGGSYNYLRGTIDINQTLGDKWAFRLNAMQTDTDSFRDGVKQKRTGLAPSLSWGLGTNNEFVASYYYLKEDNVPDFGIPYFKGRPLDVPINRFYGLAETDYERNETGIGTLTFTHRFNDHASIRSVLRVADYRRDLRATAPRLLGNPISITDNTVIRRQRQARGGIENTLTSQTEFNGKFNTGKIKHDLLAGVEFIKERAQRWTNTSPFSNPNTTVLAPNSNPILPANFDESFGQTAFNYYKGKTGSAYAQDTVQIIPHWKLLLGSRFDHMEAEYERPLPAGPLSRVDNVWSYRSGLMYQPTELSTYYVAYGTSFNPSAELYQLDNRTANTPPEKNRNMEVGAKWELLGGDLSLRTAIFRTEKTNERNTDLAQPNISLLSGRRHTEGIEIEAAGRITPKWQVFGSMALMRSNIDEAAGTQATTLNNKPINTPVYTYGLWTTYKFLKHWTMGLGIDAVGSRYANISNTNSLPSYTRIDSMLEYERKSYAVKLNVFNVFNTKYYEGVYSGHTVPGTSVTAQLTMSVKL